jgi:hypothetical protein
LRDITWDNDVEPHHLSLAISDPLKINFCSKKSNTNFPELDHYEREIELRIDKYILMSKMYDLEPIGGAGKGGEREEQS